MARLSRYSRWDGTQAVPDLDADQLLSAMSDDLLADGDLWNALRRLFQRGAQDPQGGRVPALQDLLKRPRQERQQRRSNLYTDVRNWDLLTGYKLEVLFDEQITVRLLHNWVHFAELWNAETKVRSAQGMLTE